MLGKLVIIMVLLSSYLIYLENTDEYQDKLVYETTVVKTGCVSGYYKSHITYDCSVDLDNGKRVVLNFGVLSGDKIGYYCRDLIIKDEKYCHFERVLNE